MHRVKVTRNEDRQTPCDRWGHLCPRIGGSRGLRGTAVSLTGITVILTFVFGLFDWTNYDEMIRFAMGLIGLVCFAGICCHAHWLMES